MLLYLSFFPIPLEAVVKDYYKLQDEDAISYCLLDACVLWPGQVLCYRNECRNEVWIIVIVRYEFQLICFYYCFTDAFTKLTAKAQL